MDALLHASQTEAGDENTSEVVQTPSAVETEPHQVPAIESQTRLRLEQLAPELFVIVDIEASTGICILSIPDDAPLVKRIGEVGVRMERTMNGVKLTWLQKKIGAPEWNDTDSIVCASDQEVRSKLMTFYRSVNWSAT